jgi:hypothetical protein
MVFCRCDSTVALAAYAAAGISGEMPLNRLSGVLSVARESHGAVLLHLHAGSAAHALALKSEAGLPIFALIGTLFTLCMGIIMVSCAFSAILLTISSGMNTRSFS